MTNKEDIGVTLFFLGCVIAFILLGYSFGYPLGYDDAEKKVIRSVLPFLNCDQLIDTWSFLEGSSAEYYNRCINQPSERHLVIYVAGKYNAPTDEGRLNNTNTAIDAGIEIMKTCNYPIIPHLGHWVNKRMDANGEPPRENSFWYIIDNMVIPKVDGLLKISNSTGADAEEVLAKKLGIRIYYSVNQIPNNCD